MVGPLGEWEDDGDAEAEAGAREESTPEMGPTGDDLGEVHSWTWVEGAIAPLLFLFQLVYCRFSAVVPSKLPRNRTPCGWDLYGARSLMLTRIPADIRERVEATITPIVTRLSSTMPKPSKKGRPVESGVRREWLERVLSAWPRPPQNAQELLEKARRVPASLNNHLPIP